MNLKIKKSNETIILIDDFDRKEYSIIKRYYKLDFFGRKVSTKILNQKNFNLNKVVGQFIDDPC
jgi:hypothetical protein